MSTATGIAMKTIKHEEVVYEKKWQFLEFAHKHAVTLKPDNYEYDFGVVISGGRQVFLIFGRDSVLMYICVIQIFQNQSRVLKMHTFFIG